jgi:hypothetical protein
MLKQFARQVGQVDPRICYPEGTPVDRRIFFQIVGSVISYLIIVFQFDSKSGEMLVWFFPDL